MRPATRILARTGPLQVLAPTPSATVLPVTNAYGRPADQANEGSVARPAQPASPSLDEAIGELVAAIDGELEILDALVSATQDQVKAIIGLRGLSLEVKPGQPSELAQVQTAIAALSTRLGLAGDRVREAARVLSGLLPDPQRDDADLTLTELIDRLPADHREAPAERVSALRSLAQALGELQRVSLVHANRGLQAISAWRTVLGVPQTESGVTYNRAGRSKARFPTQPTSLELEL